jgi:SAM-dependent methyltransferase
MRSFSLNLLDRFVASGERLRVLDAGCGTGGMLAPLARYGDVVGIDRSGVALGYASKRDPTALVRSSVTELPFAEGSFDLVTSFDVVYHRAVQDDQRALAEMARVLRPEGVLLVRVPAHKWLTSAHDEAVHTRQRYGRRELEHKLQAAGFDLTFSSYANAVLFPLAVAVRIVAQLRSPDGSESDVRPIPPLANRLLTSTLKAEAAIVLRRRLPFGLSLVAVARKRPVPPRRHAFQRKRDGR